jgi:FlaA1/EpsC-like NDP-sugar epimerase
LLKKIIRLSRFNKQLILITFDSIILILVLFLSFSLRLGYWYLPDNILLLMIYCSPLIGIPIFIKFGLYHSIIRYIGFKSLWTVFKAVSLYALIWGIIGFLAAVYGIPRSVVLINWLLTLIAVGGIRLIARWLLIDNKQINATNVVVYGAGSAGRQLFIALLTSIEYKPIAFIDDNDELQGQSINGVDVISSIDCLEYIKKHDVSEVLLAIPSASRKRRHEIIDFLISSSVAVRSLPSFSDLAQGKIQIEDLHEISVKDLLGRTSIIPDKKLMKKNITDKVVFVSGAGGSIGSELCKQILFLRPKILILYELNEFALYSIDSHLTGNFSPDVKVISILGSVNNTKRLSNIFKKFKVNTIYHAAAYKHVPMVESNCSEGVLNNIFGTLSCATTAIAERVETFVLISTDKAVRPTNTMGATKRFSEMILQALAESQNTTRFSIVRFGNVLDSSGSVIPLFKKQISIGGPITVTDPKIIRYFMTIPEAVELVIQAGSIGNGGEIFLLDMGKPILIADLAKKMIILSGLQVKDKNNPNGDIEIIYTGLRYGEKLYEELLIGENSSKTSHPKIMCAKEDFLKWELLQEIVDELKKSIDSNNQKQLRSLLIKAVPEFKPQSEIRDILYEDN